MAKAKDKKPAEKVTWTLTIDKDVKEGFAQLCEDIGLPMDTLAASMFQQAVRRQEVKLTPLDVNGFTPKEAAALLRSWRELQAKRDAEAWAKMIAESGQDKIDAEYAALEAGD